MAQCHGADGLQVRVTMVIFRGYQGRSEQGDSVVFGRQSIDSAPLAAVARAANWAGTSFRGPSVTITSVTSAPANFDLLPPRLKPGLPIASRQILSEPGAFRMISGTWLALPPMRQIFPDCSSWMYTACRILPKAPQARCHGNAARQRPVFRSSFQASPI